MDAKFLARKQAQKRKADDELQSTKVKKIRSMLEQQQAEGKEHERAKGMKSHSAF